MWRHLSLPAKYTNPSPDKRLLQTSPLSFRGLHCFSVPSSSSTSISFSDNLRPSFAMEKPSVAVIGAGKPPRDDAGKWANQLRQDPVDLRFWRTCERRGLMWKYLRKEGVLVVFGRILMMRWPLRPCLVSSKFFFRWRNTEFAGTISNVSKFGVSCLCEFYSKK